MSAKKIVTQAKRRPADYGTAKARSIKRSVRQTDKVAAPSISAARPKHEWQTAREKQLALWAGVIFFMAVIVSAWTLTFKANIQSHAAAPSVGGDEAAALFKNFNEAFSQVKQGWGDLRDAARPDDTNLTAVDSAGQELPERAADIEARLELEKFLYRFNDELKKQADAANN